MSITTRRQPALVVMSPSRRSATFQFTVVDEDDHPTDVVSNLLLSLEPRTIDVRRAPLMSLIQSIHVRAGRIPVLMDTDSRTCIERPGHMRVSNDIHRDRCDPVCIGNEIYRNACPKPCLRVCVCEPNTYCAIGYCLDECVASLPIAPADVDNKVIISGDLNRIHIEMLRCIQNTHVTHCPHLHPNELSLSLHGYHGYTKYGLVRSNNGEQKKLSQVHVEMKSYPKSPAIVSGILNGVGMYTVIKSIIMEYLAVHETTGGWPLIPKRRQTNRYPSMVAIEMTKKIYPNTELKQEDINFASFIEPQETMFSCHTSLTCATSYSFVMDIEKVHIRNMMLAVGGGCNSYDVYVQFVHELTSFRTGYAKYHWNSRRFFHVPFYDMTNFYHLLSEDMHIPDERKRLLQTALNDVIRIRVVIKSKNGAPMQPLLPVDVLVCGTVRVCIIDSQSLSGIYKIPLYTQGYSEGMYNR
jgi:hypothetical protein